MFFSSARGGSMNAGPETCGEEENVDGPGIFQLIDKLEQMIDHMVPQASGSPDFTEKRYVLQSNLDNFVLVWKLGTLFCELS